MAGEIFVIFAFVWFGIAFATGLHASGNDKTGLWGVLVFFTGIFGLLGYAISLASD